MTAVPATVSVTSLSGPSSASSSPSRSLSGTLHRSGPGLYEFLIEAELQHYYAGIRNDLKIQNVPQIKYVTDEDLQQIGMSKPEVRRLKKYFHKHFPQNYLSKFKKMILPRREDQCRSLLFLPDDGVERPPVKVPNKHIIPADAITVNKELGTGEFGVVQQGVWTNEGDRIQVAIKCLSRERMENNPIEFLKEAAIMHSIDHEHIVRLYGVVLDTVSLMLVTELAPLRSLLECLKEPSLRSSFPILTLCDFAIQICDGMQYLEFKRLIHRDLAARNILVFSKNKVKISDFGLSRALGVGKDYYQTNFNVNLKLPIAWCAPECITFLRFTSASDVWAFGVTLWEMFSYGFQPWAALTGQQILEAIDEPNFQRLEQPDCCPKDYYNLMLKCWQHDPNKRPKFTDLMGLLPECKPEQVQAVHDHTEEESKGRRENLVFKIGDVITVLDKSPVPNLNNCWKGILNNGKTGLFNPASTVAYLGLNLPSTKPEFTRGDGKNVYSSKRKLRADMISSPQGDLKHTGHVGLDGAYFGDISFLGGKCSSVPQVPRQVVSPYKPQEDTSYTMGAVQSTLDVKLAAKLKADSSDREPLLSNKESKEEKSRPCEQQAVNVACADDEGDSAWVNHEYHEISDDEQDKERGIESPTFNNPFDLGPSLVDEMDAMFKSFGTKAKSVSPPPSPTPLPDEHKDLAHNVRNEFKEMAARVTGSKKKQAMVRKVKPISAADKRTLESAIAMANELASRSMQELEGVSEASPTPESPRTPASPNKRKFSFKFGSSSNSRSSPKPERRNFAEEAASIPDIQSTLTEEAIAAYNSLVEGPCSDSSDNPLRMLRSGVAVKPRIRGNKRNDWSTRSLPRTIKSPPPLPIYKSGINRPTVAPPVPPPPPLLNLSSEHDTDESSGDDIHLNGNPLYDGVNPPVPPREFKPVWVDKPRHKRKYPLIIPGEGITRTIARVGNEETYVAPNDIGKIQINDANGYSNNQYNSVLKNCMGDDSFEKQIASEIDALDNIPEEDFRSRPPLAEPEQDEDDYIDDEEVLKRNRDHVSCVDLRMFSAQGSDEVRIMCKVLGKQVANEEYVSALNATNWDVHRAIKVAQLQAILSDSKPKIAIACEALNQCNWDVARAAEWVRADQDDSDTTDV